jgi:hypothetical protein
MVSNFIEPEELARIERRQSKIVKGFDGIIFNWGANKEVVEKIDEEDEFKE